MRKEDLQQWKIKSGLTSVEIAKLLSVRLDHFKSWLNSKNSKFPPDGIANDLNKIEQKIINSAEKFYNEILTILPEGPTIIALVIYDQEDYDDWCEDLINEGIIFANLHQWELRKIKILLQKDERISAQFVKFNPVSYLNFLNEKGIFDSKAHRANWGAEQLLKN